MNEPRPLTDDEHADIQYRYGSETFPYMDSLLVRAVETIHRVRAAERYWREAVKRTDPFIVHREHGGEWAECRFCSGGWGPQHRPNCPWLLAQSEDSNAKSE